MRKRRNSHKEPGRPLTKKQIKQKYNKLLSLFFLAGLIVGTTIYIFNRSIWISILSVIGVVVVLFLNNFFRARLKLSARVKKMESVFPDFLQLMSSNLRAGITIDKAMLLSARDEFHPLDKEILKTGRDITTGKNIEASLIEMSKRIGSEKIAKTILLLISGIKSGGDIATLLEQTGVNMRERTFMEKKAASNVLMYVIFIFIAVAVGAPALFGLSNLLVEILTTLLSNLPDVETANAPFTLSSISVSQTFIFYFSLAFIIVIDVLASLILGLVSKGSEKEGLKYLPVLLLISLGVFFTVKFSLSGIVSGLFA